MKLTKRKVEAGHYQLFDGDQLAGEAVLTGRTGVDDYPWGWSLADGIRARRETGVSDTLRSAIDNISYWYTEREE